MSDKILLEAKEAAHLLGLLGRALTNLARKGKVPCVVLPNKELRFRRDDLEAWVLTLRQPVKELEGKVDP